MNNKQSCVFKHQWVGCKCEICGKIRSKGHLLDGCTCTICGNDQHSLRRCVCEVCGLEFHDLDDYPVYFSSLGNPMLKCKNCGDLIDYPGKDRDDFDY